MPAQLWETHVIGRIETLVSARGPEIALYAPGICFGYCNAILKPLAVKNACRHHTGDNTKYD